VNAPAGVVALVEQPITVNAGVSDTVVLRGLTSKTNISGSRIGITFIGGAALYVENCVVDGWLVGIWFRSAGRLFVTDTTVRNSVSTAIIIAPSSGTASASIARSLLEGNGLGEDDACGVFAGGSATAVVSIRDSVLSGNDKGVCMGFSKSNVINVESSLLANNSVAGVEVGDGIARVSHSMITQNLIGLFNLGGILESFGNNVVRGNLFTNTDGTITTVPLQ
jgi:hypothetical protein